MTGTPDPTTGHRPAPHRDYAAAHRLAQQEPARFWADAVRGVSWIHRPTARTGAAAGLGAVDPAGTVGGDSDANLDLDLEVGGFERWFGGGDLNACFNALDRHVVAGRADQPALIVDSFAAGTPPRAYSYAELLDLVARFGGVLQAFGVGAGDRVLVELPARVETVIVMLACARIGAVHVLLDGDESAGELAARIAATRPAVTVGPASRPDDDWPLSGPSRWSEAIERSGYRPAQRIVVDRPPGDTDPVPGELDWAVLMRTDTVPPAACVPVSAADPLYLLFPDRDAAVAGSPELALARDLADEPADVPEPVVRATGRYVTELAATMAAIYGIGPGDVVFGAAALASPAGHAGSVYGPLFAGATTVLVDGAPSGDPASADLAEVLARHRVAAVFTTPSGSGNSYRSHRPGQSDFGWRRD